MTKVEEISHPPAEQLLGFEYCIDSNPPWGKLPDLPLQVSVLSFTSGTTTKVLDVTDLHSQITHVTPKKVEAILLGFQHYILMLGTTVMIPTLLVPQMGGTDGDKVRVIQTLLFVAGINTLLQTLFGTRLPAVIGGSYAFLIPIMTIIQSESLQSINDNEERFLRTMRAIQGALIASSSLQIILGYSGLWGIFSRFLSPLGAAPAIALVGLGLFELGFPGYFSHFKVLHKPLFERFPILLSVVVIWAFAYLLTLSGAYRNVPHKTKVHCRTDQADLISTAPWIKIPYPLQWGPPTFDAGHTFAMMASVFVSLVESTGAFFALSRLASATPPPAFVLSRGIGWQGVGILLDGLFGTSTGSTVSVENTGLLGITRVGSRRVLQIAAGFMIFFSILGKFGAFFASIPFPIFSAIYCVLFGIVAATGISFLQFTNLNSLRTLFIVGVSLFLGLSIPQYFNEYTQTAGYGPVRSGARWFDDILDVIFSSQATVALIVAVLLDVTYHVKKSKIDRGMPWWAKFRTFKGDSRSEEFYSLPLNLHKFFPPT